MRIDELATEDYGAAIELWHVCGLTRPWNDPAADLGRALTGASSTVLAASTDDGALAGTAMVGHDGHRGWLYYLAVDPARRREGVGRALVRAAERWLADRGIPKVQLMLRAGNTGSAAFYEALGYRDQEVRVMGRFFDEALEARRGSAT
ncbi:GNAT family acetyltransferase [Rothia sp. AR01]|uniref:GNAT family acetyltransferase n=1 Tax=Rothia santali TaxID=2949643 RepID=A0A9X2HGX6_9MICC|nr:GNAT family acetyltransferase [Rothia santali]MCP3424653.1 GNAT family acetyltransferase [Rothia santali]